MKVDLNEKQISWIEGNIQESKARIKETMDKGIHNLDEARSVIEYDDFLKDLEKILGISKPTVKEVPKNIINSTSSPDLDVVVESKNEPKAKNIATPNVVTSEIPDIDNHMESAKEEMEEAKEKAMEDDIFSDL